MVKEFPSASQVAIKIGMTNVIQTLKTSSHQLVPRAREVEGTKKNFFL